MGGQHSGGRKVSIENDQPVLITVSSSVVDRLNNQTTKVSRPSSEPETPSHTKPGRNFSANDFVHQDLKYKGLPYVTTKEIQQALDEEIQKNSDYWEKRMIKQKEAYEKTSKILEEEYIKATHQMEKYLPKVSDDGNKMPDCGNKSKEIVTCLQKNKEKPLLCSKEVGEFNTCIQNVRSFKIA